MAQLINTIGLACAPLALVLGSLPLSSTEDPGRMELPDAPSTLISMRLPRSEPAAAWARPPATPQANTEAQSKHGFKHSLQRGVNDQRQIWTAPFHRSAIKWDLAFLAVSGGLIAGDQHVSAALSGDHLDVSRRISDVGLAATTATVGGFWLSSLATKNPHAREAGILGMEALANTAAVYAAIQVAAGRERPLEGDGKGHFWRNNALNSSFPSGHSAFTWTAASVITHEYPRPWVKWLAYGTATTVSITRSTGLKHFPADVVIGGTLGYLIGRHIFHAHCQAGLSPDCKANGR